MTLSKGKCTIKCRPGGITGWVARDGLGVMVDHEITGVILAQKETLACWGCINRGIISKTS